MLLAWRTIGRRHVTLHWMDRDQRRGVGCYYSWLYGEPGVWTRAFGPLRLTIRSITAS